MSLHTPRFLLMALLLLLASCAEPANQGTVPLATPQPTSVPTSTATPTPIPPTPPLGPIPQHCPVSNPVRHIISPNLSSVIGTSPVWAAWIPGPNIFHLTPPPNSPYPSSYEPPYG